MSVRSEVLKHLYGKRFLTNCEIALRFDDVNPSRTIHRLRKQGEQIYTYWLRDWKDNWYVKYYRPRIELRKDKEQKIRGTYRPKG